MKAKLQAPAFKAQASSKVQATKQTCVDHETALDAWNLNLPWSLRVGIWNGRARAFTLVELLITMAIIAALTVIAVPATERVLHKTRAAHCLGNLRALGTALQLYLNDHANLMPTLVTARESKEDEEDAIDTVLSEYTEDEKFFCCKADTKRLFETTGTSYLWNNLLNGQNSAGLNFFGFIKDGTRIPVMSDKEGWHKYRDVQVNILYADGHVDKDIKFVVEE